jgi:hypothetical protein
MESAKSSETFVSYHVTTRCHELKDLEFCRGFKLIILVIMISWIAKEGTLDVVGLFLKQVANDIWFLSVIHIANITLQNIIRDW